MGNSTVLSCFLNSLINDLYSQNATKCSVWNKLKLFTKHYILSRKPQNNDCNVRECTGQSLSNHYAAVSPNHGYSTITYKKPLEKWTILSAWMIMAARGISSTLYTRPHPYIITGLNQLPVWFIRLLSLVFAAPIGPYTMHFQPFSPYFMCPCI